MTIKEVKDVYRKIESFLLSLNEFNYLQPEGSTRFMLIDDKNNKKQTTKDVDILGILKYNTNLLQHVNNIKHKINDKCNIIQIVNNFPNLITFNFDGVIVDLFVTTNNKTDIKYMTELRVNSHEMQPNMKGSFKNMLIDSLIKTKGLTLGYNNIIRYKLITDVYTNSNSSMYLSNCYNTLKQPNEYNYVNYKKENVIDVYWLDLLRTMFDCDFKLDNFKTFDNILKLYYKLYKINKLPDVNYVINDFRTIYHNNKYIFDIVEKKIKQFLEKINY